MEFVNISLQDSRSIKPKYRTKNRLKMYRYQVWYSGSPLTLCVSTYLKNGRWAFPVRLDLHCYLLQLSSIIHINRSLFWPSRDRVSLVYMIVLDGILNLFFCCYGWIIKINYQVLWMEPTEKLQ